MVFKYIPSDRNYTVYYHDKKAHNWRWCSEGCSGTATRLADIPKPRFEYRSDGKVTRKGLQRYYTDLGQWAADLNQVTYRHRKKLGLKGGFDYLYHDSHFAATTTFYHLLQDEKAPKMAKMSPDELVWYDKCCRSGLIYTDARVKGTVVDNCHGYDFKAHYQSLLSGAHGQKLRIPTKPGTLATVAELPKSTKDLQPGIYRVKISCAHPHATRVFRFNKVPYYSSQEIHHAITLTYEGFPMKVELVTDGQPNALLYRREDMVETKPYFRRWYDLISKVIRPECNNPLVKHMFSALHGCLSQRPRPVLVPLTDAKHQERLKRRGFVECGLQCTDPDPSKSEYLLLFMKSGARFSIGSRLQLWLTALSREHVGRTLSAQADRVIRVKTDGFILTAPLQKKRRGLLPDDKYTGTLHFADGTRRPEKL